MALGYSLSAFSINGVFYNIEKQALWFLCLGKNKNKVVLGIG
jgi:hypothetical protein